MPADFDPADDGLKFMEPVCIQSCINIIKDIGQYEFGINVILSYFPINFSQTIFMRLGTLVEGKKYKKKTPSNMNTISERP